MAVEQDEAFALDFDFGFDSGFEYYHYGLCQWEIVCSYHFHCCKLQEQTAWPDREVVVNEGEHA